MFLYRQYSVVGQTQGLDDEWTDDENHEGLTIYEGKRRNRVTDEEFMKNLIRYPPLHPSSIYFGV